MMRLVGQIVVLWATTGWAAIPVEQMGGRELIKEARDTVARLAKGPSVNMDDINKMNHILDALDKHMPAHADGAPISGLEQGVDTAVHAAFHPIEEVKHQANSFNYDIHNLTGTDSAWGILKGLLVLVTLYVVIGVIVMQKVYSASGIESLPHLSFWIAYPGLVMDGISFTMDRLGFSGTQYNSLATIVNKGGNTGRDTFSQFEPI